jgi:hypothetical protein
VTGRIWMLEIVYSILRGKNGYSVQFLTRQEVASEMRVVSAVTFVAGGILLLLWLNS